MIICVFKDHVESEVNMETPSEESIEKVEIEIKEQKEGKEEFNYLGRNEFTSEIYKVELRGLGFFGVTELKKFLKKKFDLDACKVKSPNKGKNFAFICFRNAEDYERALKSLNGYKWKGKILEAMSANASPDPLVLKRRLKEHQGETPPEKKHLVSANGQETCPLAQMPYDEQIKLKQKDLEELLSKFHMELCRTNKDLRYYVKQFEFRGLTPATKINGYRNKNEFTVGRNPAGKIVVGFRLGSYSQGSVEVTSVQGESLPHIPDAAKWAAATYEKFVYQCIEDLQLLPFNPITNAGHFRQLMVRTSEHTGEIMLVAGMYSSNFTDEQLQTVKDKLVKYYMSENDAKEMQKHRCTSLYYQDVKNRASGQMVCPVEHLAGTQHIMEEILSLKFRISPLAFFQVNSQSVNSLYSHIIELAQPKPESYVLDICCGTGTIGLAFAKHVCRVVGVDIVEDAIKDAKINAAQNDIKNAVFFSGNADTYIESMVKEATYDSPVGEQRDIFAIVDPPRNGLHTRSITSIRAAKDVKRLIYVSCKPASSKRNWIDLCRAESKQYKGDAFIPKKAIAVDMFPHTKHTELIMLFERD